MYEVTINMDSLPKGADVEVDGLGVFENGSTFEVSDEDAEMFRVRHQQVAFDYDNEGNMTQEVTPGPTLLQAFQHVDGFDVQVAKPKQESKKQNPNNDEGSGS